MFMKKKEPSELDKNIASVQNAITKTTSKTEVEIRKMQLDGLLATKAQLEPDRRPNPDTIVRTATAVGLAIVSVVIEQTGVFQGGFTKRIPEQSWGHLKR